MGFSDIPPPTTSCLKRCRSEDPLSFAELCSPPLKQPLPNSSHHLSILQDLESSLNAVPTIEAAPTPEELVTEMMQSLEKVMGDIGELIAGSSDSYSYAINPKLCVENTLQADEFSAYNEPSSSMGAENASSSSSEALNVCRDAAADCEESELVCEDTTLDGCRRVASNCDLASAFGIYTGDVSDGELGRVSTSTHVCTEGCVRDGCIGRDCIERLLDASDDELGLTEGTASTLATEQSDERWDLVDELTEGLALSALPSNQINWLEEGYEIPAFTLSQIEEEGLMSVARDSTELLLLDCYL